MKIYVVETLFDYTVQHGCSTSRKIAEEKAKELQKRLLQKVWVKEYTIGKDNWFEFDGD